MRPFIGATSMASPLVADDERGITYLAATNAGWLPYLTNDKVSYVTYPTHKVRRQFGLDQDVPDDLALVLDFTTSLCHFLHPYAFDY